MNPSLRVGSPNRLSAWERALRVGAVLLAVGLCAGYAISFHGNKGNEWDDVFLAASRDLADGGSIYVNVPTYTYPPFLAWLATPLCREPVMFARALWYAVLWIGLVSAVLIGWSLVPRENRRFGWPTGMAWAALGIGLFLGLKPATNSLLHHQADLFLGLFLFLGMLQLHRGRAFAGAFSLGIAAAIKCTPLLWAGYLVWKRQWLPALLLCTVAVGLNLVPSIAFPQANGETHLETWGKTVFLPTQGESRYPGLWNVDPLTNQSMAGSMFCWFATETTVVDGKLVVSMRKDPAPASMVRTLQRALVLSLLGLALLSVWARPGNAAHRSQAEAFEFAQVLMLMLLISPMSHKTHFFTLLLPGLLLGHRAFVERGRSAWIFLGITMLLQLGTLRPLGVLWTHWGQWYGVQMLSSLVLWAGCAQARWSLGKPGVRESAADPTPLARAA